MFIFGIILLFILFIIIFFITNTNINKNTYYSKQVDNCSTDSKQCSSCSSNRDCQNPAYPQCAHNSYPGTDDNRVCCPSNFLFEGKYYCENMPNDTPCKDDSMCISRICANDNSGFSTGKCGYIPILYPANTCYKNQNVMAIYECNSPSDCSPNPYGGGCYPLTSNPNGQSYCCIPNNNGTCDCTY